MSDFMFQTQSNSISPSSDEAHTMESGSPENHRPYVPKYSKKDECLLRRVDLTSLESINSAFFPDEYQKGKVHWVVVPKHILGVDTDFAFVAKKLDEYRQLDRLERQRELSRWDKMARWERNMYEDRIAILMQQKTLLEGGAMAMGSNSSSSAASNGGGGVLTSRGVVANGNKRPRDFALTVKPVASAAVVSSDVFAVSATQSIANYSEVPDSKRRCLRLKPPIPSRFQGDMEGQKDAIVPEFISLMNFPALSLPDNLRCCVMCGTACPTSAAMKSKKLATGRGSKANAELAFIPTQNKGLCTLCDVNVWVISSSQMEIKWCKGCKNFRCWAAFGDKGHATKCMRCRERQREKYAAQKEEKEKSGGTLVRTPSSSKKANNN